MEDSLYSTIKENQRRWMREREVEQARGGMESESVGDLVNKLADRVSANRQPRELLHKSVADELDANTCSICLELMLPPTNSPVILFPCGHTFCKLCVTTSEQKHLKKVCPSCKAKIGSTAVNYSLQNVIVAYAESKRKPVQVQQVPSDNLQLRLSILREELVAKNRQSLELQESIEVSEGVIELLRDEEISVLERLKAIQRELNLVRHKIEEHEDELSDLRLKKTKTEQSVKLIEATIDPLEAEQAKNKALASLY